MDVRNMLNSAPAPEKRSSQIITAHVHTTPRPGASQLPGTPDGYARNMYSASPSQQQTPVFSPPSRQASSLTPLQTPSQYPPAAQYPFPQPPTSQRPSTSHSHKRLSIQSVLSSPAPPATEEHVDSESVSPKTIVRPRLSESQSSSVDTAPATQRLSQDSIKQEPAAASRPSMEPPQPPPANNKRSAGDAELDDQTATPQKQQKLRKYTERPPWARLARCNPHFKSGCNDTTQPANPARSRTPLRQDQTPAPAVNGHTQPHQNGHQQHHKAPIDADRMPWQHETPIDLDLLKARELFGQWEKSFQWYTPMPDVEAAVMDWLVIELNQLQDVGYDPQEGSIEIEAKIGRVINKATNERILPSAFPAVQLSVLSESFALNNTRFESEMEMKEHRAANNMLNAATQASHQNPGRARIEYRHLYETDSFQKLSVAGIQALPQSLQKRNRRGRDLSLRTTRNTKTGEIVARIVKVHIADLHLYNPRHDYDCRITINVECNLLHCGLSEVDLVEPPADGLEKSSRMKDRLSYKHLGIFSIDLTQVSVAGLAPKHELEVEVDAGRLREQMERMQKGEESAFHDVVGTFLGNVTILMRMKTK
ncbi:mRNA triphosphatase CET1 [Teratosphaeria nubilosa]|uniref:mRNA-capping enzyme subunit beta n=1 Tax=Teratosphaeria nubilosa TaxID=161662 RepID=A0A6G1LDZ1_9PEZI|nr:mRNA triphosphatase CET1 [Teratosphaeria nubilosa]